MSPVNHAKSFWLVADHHTLKLVSSDTGGAVTVIETVAQPGFGPPPHIHHRQDECFCITEGTFEFTEDGRAFTGRAGDVIFLAKDRLHTHQAGGDKPARAFVFYTPAGLERFIEEAGTPVTDAAAAAPQPTLADLERIVAIAAAHGIEVPRA